MSATHEIEYKGKKIKITVAKTSQGMYVGTFGITHTEPPIRDVGADSNSEEGALANAEHKAKERIDALG